MDIANHNGAATFFDGARGGGEADTGSGGGGNQHGFAGKQLVAFDVSGIFQVDHRCFSVNTKGRECYVERGLVSMTKAESDSGKAFVNNGLC